MGGGKEPDDVSRPGGKRRVGWPPHLEKRGDHGWLSIGGGASPHRLGSESIDMFGIQANPMVFSHLLKEDSIVEGEVICQKWDVHQQV